MHYTETAGRMLRRLRLQRNLTLQDVATQLNVSVAALSRKERGIDAINRIDIRLAIQALQLTPWEAHELWTAAGFIPESGLVEPRDHDLRTFAETLLSGLPYPAYISDLIGYVQAWNQGFEALWEASQSTSRPLHLLQELFTSRARARLGERWQSCVEQTIALFYQKTLRLSNDPRFRALLQRLQEQHGAEFTAMWNQAQQRRDRGDLPLPVAMGGTLVSYASPLGSIEYLLMQSSFQLAVPYELYLYVPFGEESQQRYSQFQALLGPDQIYYAEGPAYDEGNGSAQ
ncbi:helix-turn-helix domain-containing protein [Litorilinea aerophila]|nr:helix-turn-helix domain-containing protein [Litorilinea aerophila]MCC9075951.1 helix-turn-helix domain-containing protein [Litorilinea aerophila]OUC09100.1 hypothetical protein RY27_04925 [Litorilinea aerophila]